MITRDVGNMTETEAIYPEIEAFINQKIEYFRGKNPAADDLCGQIERGTSTRIIDWVDHLVLPESSVKSEQLERLGYEQIGTGLAEGVTPYRCETCGPTVSIDRVPLDDDSHPFLRENSILPPVLLTPSDRWELAIRTEGIEGMRKFREYGLHDGVFGFPYQHFEIHFAYGFLLSAVERRGYSGFVVHQVKDHHLYIEALNQFKARERSGDPRDRMRELLDTLEGMTKDLPPARMADAFMRAERRYWRLHNAAAQWQRERQVDLVLGWENHDHHVYRSSRELFPLLIQIFETMGFKARERLRGASGGGWGAQVMEQPDSGLVVVAEVDLEPEDWLRDFAHEGLGPTDSLGTVGLWTAIHGESMMGGGLHHLAIRCDEAALARDLEKSGFSVSRESSDHLVKLVTGPEMRSVDDSILGDLAKKGRIGSDRIASGKVPYSHLSGVQRSQGYMAVDSETWDRLLGSTEL